MTEKWEQFLTEEIKEKGSTEKSWLFYKSFYYVVQDIDKP